MCVCNTCGNPGSTSKYHLSGSKSFLNFWWKFFTRWVFWFVVVCAVRIDQKIDADITLWTLGFLLIFFDFLDLVCTRSRRPVPLLLGTCFSRRVFFPRKIAGAWENLGLGNSGASTWQKKEKIAGCNGCYITAGCKLAASIKKRYIRLRWSSQSSASGWKYKLC
jgi:hypothetical protein